MPANERAHARKPAARALEETPAACCCTPMKTLPDGNGRHGRRERRKGHHETDEKDLMSYVRHASHPLRDTEGAPSGTGLGVRVLRTTVRSTEEIVAEVAACVRSGGTVIFPTETVYGIGCDPENDVAIDAIYEAKGRSAQKPLALHVLDLEQALPYVAAMNETVRAAIARFWPGALAIIVSRRALRFEHAACGLPTISLRCPSLDVSRRILEATGPLAATSANRSGAGAYWAGDSVQGLPAATLAVLSGPTALRQESTIVDCTSPVPRILREGAISRAALEAALGTLRAAP